jgi:hypothetical protein
MRLLFSNLKYFIYRKKMSDDVDESVYLRVTTPLQRYNGYRSIPPYILAIAADRGTRVHKYCELFALRMLFGDIDEDCLPYLDAFIDWFDENVEEVYCTEERLFCDKLKIQGQIDLIARVKGFEGTSLIDIKTSLTLSRSYNLQTAAYQHLCESNRKGISHRLIIQLTKNSTFNVIEFDNDDYEEELNIYCGILAAYRYFQ